MKKAAYVAPLLLLALFIALLAYGLVSKSPDTTIDSSLARAKAPMAPDFELAVLAKGTLGTRVAPRVGLAMADGRLALSELRGVPLALNFWASWCPPCRTEAPRLEAAWRTAKRQGVLVLGLDMQDVSDDAREFIAEFGLSYPNVRDPDNDVALDFGLTGLPETFFISARGRVVGHVIGAVSDRQLRDGLAAARAGRIEGARRGGDRRETR